jgi:nitroreductase
MEKPATTDHPIHDIIRRRWSPYTFADRPVEREKVLSLLEAARWSASAFNEQPWRFILATKDDPDAYAKALGCLVEANRGWAKQAPVLILTVSRTTYTRNDKPNRVHQHDLGLAVQNLVVQATSMDLFAHQMAGVDLDKVRSGYSLPSGFEPQTAIAIGYGLDADEMPEDIRDKESSPRSRMPLTGFVFGGTWGEASGLVQDG